MTTTLHRKFKRAALYRFLAENGSPTATHWLTFGKALERRYRILDGLLSSVKRGKLTEQELINRLGGLMIIRQTEEDLALYQEQLEALTEQLQAGEIDESEFEERLAAMAAAILLIMFLLGSGDDDESRLASLRLTLETGGEVAPDLDLSGLPDEAQDNLREAFEIAETSAAGLGLAILAGDYEEGRDNLAARLAMWLGTAAGVYALGQLFKQDNVRYQWLRGPTRDSCGDCRGLHGQIHTAAEWKAFYTRTGKAPKSAGLECKGFRCQCSLIETDRAISGNFI